MAWALGVALALGACGGGGGGGEEPAPPPPAAATAPSITTQPANVSVTAGQPASFTVSASGTAPLQYQWQRNGGDIAGATAASYTLAAAALADNGATFSVRVSNPAGSVTSTAATLSVGVAVSPPAITQAPQSQSVTVGQPATFSVTATGSSPLTYQWRRNGVDISGANGAAYTTPAVTLADNGAVFTVRVSNAAGSVVSAAAGLTVTAASTGAVYSRGITGLFAGSYGAGCTGTGGASGPIGIASDGTVQWNGGSFVAGTSAVIGNSFGAAASNNFRAGESVTQLDAAGRSAAGALAGLSVHLDHDNLAQSQARTFDLIMGNSVLCSPGVNAGATHKPIADLVASWWEGVTATLSCSVLSQGGATQSLVFSLRAKVLRLGAVQLALDAPHRYDLVSGGFPPSAPAAAGEQLDFGAIGYASVSDLRMWRYAVSRQVFVHIVLPSGETYTCTGERDA
jgi:hypothetical protein